MADMKKASAMAAANGGVMPNGSDAASKAADTAAAKIDAQVKKEQADAQARVNAFLAEGAALHGKHAKAVHDDTAALKAAADAQLAFNDKVSEIYGKDASPYEQAAAGAQKEKDALLKLADAANKMRDKGGGLKVTLEDIARANAGVNQGLAETAAKLKAADLGPVAAEALHYADALRVLKLNIADLSYSEKDAAAATALLTTQHELAAKAARDQLDPGAAVVRDLQDQLKLLNMTSAAQATFNSLKVLGSGDQFKYHDAILAANQAIEEQTKSIAKQDSIRGDFTNFFGDVISGSKSASQAFRDFANAVINDLSRMAAQEAVDALFGKQGQNGGGFLGNLLSSLFGGSGSDPTGSIAGSHQGDAALAGLPGFAMGGVFSRGNVIPFASGGIVSSPMTFPMASGRTGLMGEAGPEAIVPLSRGNDGKLGIRSSGGGGNSINTSVTVVINQDGSASGKTQSDAATGKAAGDAIQAITTKTVIDMLRPGGILWGQRAA